MNNRLNLFSDKIQINNYKNKQISQEDIINIEEKCEFLFENWHFCVKKKSWNDEECLSKHKSEYELCIQEKNLLTNLLEKQIDNKNI